MHCFGERSFIPKVMGSIGFSESLDLLKSRGLMFHVLEHPI